MIETLNSMGGWWWSWLRAMAWQVALLALVVWLIDLVLRRRGWPQVRYALWALVLVKLFIPPTFALPSSVFSRVLPVGEQVALLAAPDTTELAQPVEAAAFEPLPRAVSAGAPAEALPAAPVPAEAATSASLSFKAWAMLGTGAVSLLLLTWLIVRALRLRRLILADATKGAPDWMSNVLARCARRVGLRRVPRVVVTEGVKSAAVFGVWRPVLLLPRAACEVESPLRMEHIMLHELAHVKRGDLLMNTAQALVQVAFWFHPAVWLAGRSLRHLRELCCDASVSRLLRERTSEYRETLADAARSMMFGRERPGLGLLGLFESASRLRQRLEHLERPSWKHGRLKVIASLAAAALMAACIVPMARVAAEAKVPGKAGGAVAETTAHPRVQATLPNGVTVELAGVSYHPSETQPWWRPDGMPLSDVSYYVELSGRRPQGLNRVFVVRVQGGAPGAPTQFDITGALATQTGWAEVWDDELPRGLRAAAAEIPPGEQECALRVGVATGWETVGQTDGHGLLAIGFQVGGIIFTDAHQEEGSSAISALHDLGLGFDDWRIVAVDQEGHLHTSDHPGAVAAGTMQGTTALFKGLPLDQVEEFRLQARQYQWVEFRNVSLKPGHKTDVEVVVEGQEIPPGVPILKKTPILQRLSEPERTTRVPERLTFGPVIERVVKDSRQGKDCYIDFDDTGRLLTPPSPDILRDGNAFSAWINEAGVDAVGIASERERRLGGFHLVALPVANERWNASPIEVARRASGASPAAITHMRASQELPATFFIKTREGGIGILEIQDNAHRHPEELSVRFQMLSARAAQRAARLVTPEPSIRLVAVANLKTGETVDKHGKQILYMPERPPVPDPERLEDPLVVWVEVPGGDRKSLVDWSLADRESGGHLRGGGSQRHHTYETEDGTKVYRAALQMRLPLDVARPLELRARVAAGNWYQVGNPINVQGLEKYQSRSEAPVYPLSIEGIAVVQLAQKGNDVGLSLTMSNSIWKERAFWARAARKDGGTIEPLSWNPGTGTTSVISFTFSRQELSELDSITVLQRPCHEIAIDFPTLSARATSTKVEQETKPEAGATFGPVIEQTVQNMQLVDFDTGRLLEKSEDGPRGQMPIMVSRAKETGADAYVFQSEGGRVWRWSLVGCEMAIRPLRGDASSDLTPAEARNMAEKLRSIDMILPLREPPESFLIRTREGGMGILQIVGFTEEPKGVRIRYRMVGEPEGLARAGTIPQRLHSEKALLAQEMLGHVFAVHELARCGNGMVYAVCSMRPTAETLAELGPIDSVTMGSHHYGSFALRYWTRGTRGELWYRPITLAELWHDGVCVEWCLLDLRGDWPEAIEELEIGVHMYTRSELQEKLKAEGAEWNRDFNPLATVPMASGPPLSAERLARKLRADIAQIDPSVLDFSVALLGHSATDRRGRQKPSAVSEEELIAALTEIWGARAR